MGLGHFTKQRDVCTEHEATPFVSSTARAKCPFPAVSVGSRWVRSECQLPPQLPSLPGDCGHLCFRSRLRVPAPEPLLCKAFAETL